CSPTRASARSARFFHRLISRSCSASFLSRGSTTRRAGPRFFGAPASSPRSRAARHVASWDESSPSRRSNAPIAPGVLQPSAPRTIFRLYSTVNRRRVAFATTSIADPPRACSHALIALQSCLALDTKLPGGHCLTHIGREGAPGLRLAQAAERYLTTKARKRSLREDHRILEHLKSAFGAETSLAEITASRISEYKAGRLAARSQRRRDADKNPTPLSAASINRPLALLRHLLRIAHEEW